MPLSRRPRLLLAAAALTAVTLPTAAAVAADPGPSGAAPEQVGATYPLRASADGTEFVTADGRPHTVLADTSWLSLSGLDRAELVRLLDTRAAQGFTALQAMALPLATDEQENALGDKPFRGSGTDLSRPKVTGSEDYWDHVEFAVDQAAERGMQVILVPSWYGFGGRQWLPRLDVQEAAAYGRFLGERLGDKPNLMWLLGGDTTADSSRTRAITDAMAEGIRQTEAVPHLMSYHHARGTLSSDQGFGERDWHTFTAAYAGSRPGVEEVVDRAYGAGDPVLMVEAWYDDRAAELGRGPYLDRRELRAQAYASVLGGAGFSYGHEKVWDLSRGWERALDAGSAQDLRPVADLPDGLRPVDGVLADGGDGAHSARVDGTTAVYLPSSRRVVLEARGFDNREYELTWVDPEGGERVAAGTWSGRPDRELSTPDGWADALLVVTPAQ